MGVLTISWARADKGGYTLKHVTINAVVHENNTWDVTETLEVDFAEPRHGIYKYIPSRFFYGFTNPDGSKQENVYKNRIKDVWVDGYDYKTDTDDTAAENTIIQIGSANSYVEGLQVYNIQYTLQYMDDRIDSEDFLCHTIWGSGWNTDVEALDFNIQFDKALPASIVEKLNIYSGARGSNVNADSVQLNYDAARHTLVGSVQNLPANHAITISASLPQGFWKAETKNMFLFYAFVLLAIVCAVLFFIEIFKTNRRKPIPVVTFYPPQGISSAEVGKIIDNSTDPVDLASLVPWLAHRGHITIEEVPDRRGRVGKYADLKLTKRIPLSPDAPKYQHLFMDAIFDGKKSVCISELGDRHIEMQVAKSSLDLIFTGEKALSDYNWGAMWWFFMLVCALGAYWTGHVTDMFNSGLAMIAAFSTLGASFIIGVIRMITSEKRSFRSTASKIGEAVGCVLLFAASLAIHFSCFDDSTFCVPSSYFVVGSIVLGLISYMCDRYGYDTEYRLRIMGELLGLRNFIKAAELPRLKMLVDENPSYFYEVLPYAMVFGLSDKWSDLFKNIDMNNPDWYYSANNAYLTSSLLANTISANVAHSIKDAIAQASVDPTSSSSSGGYSGGGSSFSGGGGGGGGGGSW